MKTPTRRVVAAMAATAAAMTGLAVAGAQQADATTVTRVIYADTYGNTVDTMNIYYNSNEAGAGARLKGNIPSYTGGISYHCDDNTVCAYTFIFTGGSGNNYPVKNNAASAYNDSGNCYYKVYYNSNYLGRSEQVDHEYTTNDPHNFSTSGVKNNNAGQKLFC